MASVHSKAARRARTAASTAALAVLAGPLVSLAQQSSTTLAPVTVTGRLVEPLTVGGWGDVPPERMPLQSTTIGSEQMRNQGVARISDATRIDAAVGDAYNAEGYWDFIAIRGFVLDNRFNYRRDGLPVNAETSLPLDNKERIEILKGLSGLQAGSSAPGGLVNLVVKRPLPTTRYSATLGWRSSDSRLASADLNQRLGESAGLRVNAAYEQIDPVQRNASGHRHLLAAAGELKLGANTRVEAEFETSHRSQPSVVGFSLLGNTVPDPKRIDPRVNLNDQPWTQPVVFDGDTASLRVTQQLSGDWRAVAHAMTQRLRSDDRTAFPFGRFTDPANFVCDWCDRFAPDGSFTYWEFISDGERRRTDALELSLSGKLALGGQNHRVQAGVLRSLYRATFGPQIFDIAGPGTIDGNTVSPRSSGFLDTNTNRSEGSTEFYARDQWQLTGATSLWLGARHTQLSRSSVRTDASEPTSFEQSYTTPFVALSHEFMRDHVAYASWGRGVESDVAPNRDRYTNAGQALPALKSRQFELGLKASSVSIDWNAAWFDIERPLFADIGACDLPGTCTRQLDGTQRHRGLEAGALWRIGSGWMLGGGAQWLRARRTGSLDPALNGLRPVNVPSRSLKALAGYDVAALPGLNLQVALAHDSDRMAVPDNSIAVGGWTRLDLMGRYEHKLDGTTLTWRAGVDNATDRRAWKEAPYQFGHSYLFPLPPRTWRLSVQADL